MAKINMRDLKDNTPVYSANGQQIGTARMKSGKLYLNDQAIDEQYYDRYENQRLYLTSAADRVYMNQSAGAQSQGMRGDTRTQGMRSDMTDEREVRVPVSEERLAVGKREVEAGEVEVQKRVTSEHQSVPVELRQERAHIERVDSSDRVLSESEAGQAFQEGTIRVPLRGEQAVASKETIVTGEVVITRESESRTQNVEADLRREEVEVDEHINEQYQQMRPVFEEHFNQRGAQSGRRFQDAEPNYRLGMQTAADQRFRGRRFEDAETDIRRSSNINDDSRWQQLREEVREGFNRYQ